MFIRIQIMQRTQHDCAYLEKVVCINFVMLKIPPVLLMSTQFKLKCLHFLSRIFENILILGQFKGLL